MRPLAMVALVLAACESHAPAPAAPSVDAAPMVRPLDPAQASEAMAQNCQMCHALDLVRSQRLGRAGWEKELKKMIGWGAPVPAEAVTPIVDLLTEQLGADVPPTPPAELDVATAERQVAPDPQPVTGDAKKGAATYQVACASCHGAEGGGGTVGPALAQRPVLYRARDFEEVVRTGRLRMPAVPLDAATVRDVIVFLRARP